MKFVRNQRIIFGIIGFLLITGIVIGSFFDFQINSTIYVGNKGLIQFMSAFGEYPGYGFLSFLGGFIGCSAIKNIKNNKWFILLFVASLVCIGCSLYFQANALTNVNGYDCPDKKLTLGLLISFLTITPLYVLGYLMSKKSINPNLWKIALVVALAYAISVGIITLIKGIPHRPRFRFLISQNEVNFHNWWEPLKNYKDYVIGDVTKEEFKSFPSGHTSTASMLFSIIFIPVLCEKKNITMRFNFVIFFIGVAYIVWLALSRMLAGAHFLTDVCFGSLISLICQYSAYEINNKYFFKKEKMPQQ